MTAPAWPRQGTCGSCGRDAEQAPSGRWCHKGRPCRARSQIMWWIDDIGIAQAVAFVPDGDPLPAAPDLHMHTESTVSEFLAQEAEEAR